MNDTGRGFLVLLGAALIHLTLGVLYCFGNLSTYLVSYLRERTSSSNLQFSDTQWILTLMILGQGATMVVGGILEQRIGSRLTILVGCSIHTASTALSYFSIASFYSLVATYGVTFGVGVGIACSPSITLPMKWLPRFRGLVAGGVVAGFGLGAMVFNPIITIYINPNNTSPGFSPNGTDEKYFHDPEDKALLDRVPSCFLVMAAFFLLLQTIGNVLLKEAPPAEESAPPGALQNNHSTDLISENERDYTPSRSEDERDYTPSQILKTMEFWVLWVAFLCNNQGIWYCTTYWKKFGQNFISDDFFLACAGSAGSISNSFSRIMWGAVGDKFGYKTGMCALQGSFALLYVIMFYTQASKWGYAAFVCCLFFCVGGSFSLLPAVTSKTFGRVNSTANYGLVFSAAAVGALLNVLLMNSALHDVTSQQKQWTMAAFLAAGLVATLLFRSPLHAPQGYTALPHAN